MARHMSYYYHDPEATRILMEHRDKWHREHQVFIEAGYAISWSYCRILADNQGLEIVIEGKKK